MEVVSASAAQVGRQHRLHGVAVPREPPGSRAAPRRARIRPRAPRASYSCKNRAGQHGCQHACISFFFSAKHLVAHARMLHVEGNHLAQPEAQHRQRFGRLCGQGIEVQHETRAPTYPAAPASPTRVRGETLPSAVRIALTTASVARRFGFANARDNSAPGGSGSNA